VDDDGAYPTRSTPVEVPLRPELRDRPFDSHGGRSDTEGEELSMMQVEVFLESYGYGALFVLGFAEFIGVPVATVPVLLVTGALASRGTLQVEWVVLSVALGGLLADNLWMAIARRRGRSIVDVACGLSINPRSCVLRVCENVGRFGAPYLVLGKFIPGTSGLLATAAALSGVRWQRFIVVDTVALLLWATTYTALGWVFAGELGGGVAWAASHLMLMTGGLLMSGAFAVWARLTKVKVHRRKHAEMAAATAP